MAEAQIQAAETFFEAASDSQCLKNIAAMQYRQLAKVRQLDKQVHFMERRQDAQSSLPAEAPQTETERATEPDTVAGSQSEAQRAGEETDRQREWDRERGPAWQVERHMWQCQTERQQARLANDKAATLTAQAERAQLRRQAIWQAASPGCFACCWRWLCLPRSL